MKKIMSQGENGSFLLGLTSANEKPRRSLSAKLNDKNTSYFRITWTTSSTFSIHFILASFRVPRFLILVVLFLIKDLNEQFLLFVSDTFARVLLAMMSRCFFSHRITHSQRFLKIHSQNSVLWVMLAGFTKEASKM